MQQEACQGLVAAMSLKVLDSDDRSCSPPVMPAYAAWSIRGHIDWTSIMSS
jgi:hypothetical protein